MTIVILFQQSGYRSFKAFYTQHVQQHLRGEFPQLVSYQRFVELVPRVLAPLTVYLQTQLGQCSGPSSARIPSRSAPNRASCWRSSSSYTASRRAVVERGHATTHPPRTPSDR